MEPTMAMSRWKIFFFFIILCTIMAITEAEDKQPEKKIGKDIRDYTDADLERLLDQWMEDDDPLEPDELPEHLRPQPKLDLSQMDFSNPDNILKMSKKGKSVMMFVDINPEISESEANTILGIWQTSLRNNHIIAERYPIDIKRALFMFPDGAQAVDAKNFFIEQPECSHVTLEGQDYVGKYASEGARKRLEKLSAAGKVKEPITQEKEEL